MAKIVISSDGKSMKMGVDLRNMSDSEISEFIVELERLKLQLIQKVEARRFKE